MPWQIYLRNLRKAKHIEVVVVGKRSILQSFGYCSLYHIASGSLTVLRVITMCMRIYHNNIVNQSYCKVNR